MRLQGPLLGLVVVFFLGPGCNYPNSSPQSIQYILVLPHKLPADWLMAKVSIDLVDSKLKHDHLKQTHSDWLAYRHLILPGDEIRYWSSGYDEEHGTANGYCVIRNSIVIKAFYVGNTIPTVGGQRIK